MRAPCRVGFIECGSNRVGTGNSQFSRGGAESAEMGKWDFGREKAQKAQKGEAGQLGNYYIKVLSSFPDLRPTEICGFSKYSEIQSSPHGYWEAIQMSGSLFADFANFSG